MVGGARRFLRDVSFFSAVEHLDDAGWSDLAELAGPGAMVVLARDEVPTPPAGWAISEVIPCHQMVVEELKPPPEGEPGIAIRPLTAASSAQALELAGVAQPGPFLARTVELGFAGVVEGDRLVAMAGERLRLPGHSEISGVCTHPDAQGRGLGAAVTRYVAAGILGRGETPFLHVSHHNDGARRLYERLGFTVRRTLEVGLLTTPPGAGR